MSELKNIFTDFEDLYPELFERSATGNIEKGLVGWLNDVLSTVTEKAYIDTVGVYIYPQFGEMAGQVVNLTIGDTFGYGDQTIDLGNKLKSTIDSHNPVAKLKELECSLHIDAVLIDRDFSTPIGILWTHSSDENIRSRDILNILNYLISTSIQNEKNRFAMHTLATLKPRKEEPIEHILYSYANNCLKAIGCNSVMIWGIDKDSNQLHTLATTAGIKVDMCVGEGLVGKAFESSHETLVNDLLEVDEIEELNPLGVGHKKVIEMLNWRSALIIPMRLYGEKLGIIAIYSNKVKGINRIDQEIAVAFSHQISATLAKFKSHRDLQALEDRLRTHAPAISNATIAVAQVHDAKNFLTMANSSIGEIARHLNNRHEYELREEAIQVATYISRCQNILTRVGESRRITSNSRRKIIIHRTVEDIIDIARRTTTIKVQIENKVDSAIEIYCDEVAIERAFVNIITNSIRALEKSVKNRPKIIAITSSCDVIKNLITLSFTDNGMGIPTSDLQHVFLYNYTTNDMGFGFGLPIVKAIVESHGGKVTLQSEFGNGTNVVIELPVAATVVESSTEDHFYWR